MRWPTYPRSSGQEGDGTTVTRRGGLSSTAPGGRGWRDYAPILLVFVFGSLVSWLVFAKVSHLETQRQHSAFAEAARDRLLVVQREVASALGLVQDVGAFFDASRQVTRRQFREFVGPALKRNQGVESLQWVPRVTSEERRAFVSEARLSFPPFRMTERQEGGGLQEAASLEVHFPVLYIQPYGENKQLLGLDLAADTGHFAILRDAAQAQRLLVSAPSLPSPAVGDQSRFTVYLPVYERSAEDEAEVSGDRAQISPLQTPEGLRGYAIGRFLVPVLVEQALSNLSAGGVDIRFYASPAELREPPFYVHASRTRHGRPATLEEQGEGVRSKYRGEILVGNRKWTIVCNPVPGYFETDSWSGYLILGGGIAFTLLASLFLLTSVGRAEQVRSLVAQRTLELERSNSALNNEIAERRRAERALQMLNVTLEHRVARRTAQAERRAGDLEQFAYVASHDLKAPLRAIANLAGWLKEDLKDRLTSETSEQLDLLRDRVARMHALIEGLLAYSRIGRSRGSLEEVDTAELLADTIDSIAPPPGFKVEVNAVMPSMFTDRLHLGQVFANLIANAISHHDRTAGLSRVTGTDLGDRFAFEVADDGPGIPKEYQRKVFLMFQTLQVKDFGGDTGIGLALVKKLVEEHGGTISLESGPGRGSKFSFTWAKTEPEPDTQENERSGRGIGET